MGTKKTPLPASYGFVMADGTIRGKNTTVAKFVMEVTFDSIPNLDTLRDWVDRAREDGGVSTAMLTITKDTYIDLA